MRLVIGIIILAVSTFLFVFLIGKRRRKNMFNHEIMKLIASGEGNTILHNVYYEEALRFAIKNGAEIDNSNLYQGKISIGFTMEIEKAEYHIFFARTAEDDSVFLGVDNVGHHSQMDPRELIKSILTNKYRGWIEG
jgi:hypothetical protein